MPGTSVAQRQFFGWAEHHPDQAKAEGKYPSAMSHSRMHDFAATPEKGLPAYVAHHEDGRSYYGKPKHAATADVSVPSARRYYGK